MIGNRPHPATGGRAEVIARVLRAEGEIHSWRCDYPDRYGPCDCCEQLAQLILEALDAHPSGPARIA